MIPRFVPLAGPTEAAPLGGGECASIPRADELSDWAQEDFDLDARLAGKLGFGVGGAGLETSHRLLIREFSRSATCTGPDGVRYRYGTAVRLVVKVASTDVRTGLTIALVAAETQVGRMQAESTLRVVGYAGEKLAALLPPFRTFNVDAYAELSTRMNDVKRLIGGDVANIRPVKLGVEIAAEEPLDAAAALGLIWGLSCIRRRQSCEEAKRAYPDPQSLTALRAIEEAYLRVPNPTGCTGERPSKLHQEAARELLRGLELTS